MNRVRILYCIDNFEPDGAQRQLVDLVKNIDQALYDISVCGIRSGSLQKEVEAFGIPVHAIGKKAWWEFPWVVNKLWKYFKKERPTIIQSSLFYTNLLTGSVGKLLGVPIIITVQHSIYEKDLSCWMKPLALFTALLSDVTVTVFEKGGDCATHKRTTVSIPNGVDLARFESVEDRETLLKRYGADCDDIILFSAGRLSVEKGHKYLIEAIGILKETHPQIRLLIAGDGELRGELERYVRDLELIPNVQFLGRRDDIHSLFRLSRLVVFPSVHEGFGLVVAEAMASRSPIIATRAVSVTDLVIDNKTGFLVPVKNPVAIAEKVKWVLDHPETARDVADAGYKRVKTLFSSQTMAKRYMDLYEKLLSKKNLSVSI